MQCVTNKLTENTQVFDIFFVVEELHLDWLYTCETITKVIKYICIIYSVTIWKKFFFFSNQWLYPNKGLGDNNFCRSPNYHDTVPWCLTSVNGSTWGKCDVPECEGKRKSWIFLKISSYLKRNFIKLAEEKLQCLV